VVQELKGQRSRWLVRRKLLRCPPSAASLIVTPVPNSTMTKLPAALDERRTVAESELEKLTHYQERIAELERESEALMELYSYQARERLDLYTLQDRHDAYRALGIKVIARPDGSTELTGSVLANVHSDNGCAIPNEEYHALAR
jgi:hypothetical protein